jgi:NADH-quinone oxidoreductase subunit M
MLERRRGTRLIDDFGGLWKSVPLLGSLLLTVVLASIGLPGLSGFPGEFTLLVGVFQESVAAAAFATLGIVLAAWYMLGFFRDAFTGPLVQLENRVLPDLHRREAVILVPLLVLILVIGLLPNLVFYATDDSVDLMLRQAGGQSTQTLDDPEQISWFGPGDYQPATTDHGDELNLGP